MIPAINRIMLAISSSLAASIVAKVTVIVALALFAAWLARGSRAAVRHAFLAAAFGVTLLLPIASLLVPPVHLGVPVVEDRAAGAQPLVSGGEQSPPILVTDDPDARVLPAPPSSKFSLSHLLLAVWIAGCAIFLLPVVIGLWQIRLIRRSGLPWRHGQSLAETIALEAGVHRRVQVLLHKQVLLNRDALLHEAVLGPITCGTLHPAIVLPQDAVNWDAEDLNRAFLHELEHVRRGDSLTRSLARGACAVYWFNPLVWIAWRRLALEAERSCDDAVLRRSEATAYADQLVGLAQRLSTAKSIAQRSPLLAMANRADLATRVRAVLDARQQRGRAGAPSLGLATTAAMVLVLSMSSLMLVATPQAAPAQPATPKFEVTSVRLHTPNSGLHPQDCSGDRFISTGIGLANLLSETYQLEGMARSEFLQRVPESIRQKVYDIQAKAAAPIASESQCRLMVQALLADRFKLAFHYEQRDVDLFDLVVARGGPKLQKALPTDEGTDINIVINGTLVYTWAPIADADTREHTKGMTMQELARRLPTLAPQPVADKTGLEGRYKIDLRYSTSLAADNQDTPEDPPLEAALAKLGLRLEKHKGSVKVPVLDHIEPPDAN